MLKKGSDMIPEAKQWVTDCSQIKEHILYHIYMVHYEILSTFTTDH